MISFKKLGKNFLCAILEWQVKKLRASQDFIIVAVAGSVGKTSTKTAVAKVLSANMNVRFQEGNYNDRLTVPLVIFGHNNPKMFDLIAWLKIFMNNQKQIKNWSTEAVVVELGTDGPGQIHEFTYLHPDLSVVTAVAAEHMEFFGTLDNVAKEELNVIEFSKRTIINIDDIDDKYLHLHKQTDVVTVSFEAKADYMARFRAQTLKIAGPSKFKLESKANVLGTQGAKSIAMAIVVADQLKLKVKPATIEKLRPFNGRMNPLPGIKNSLIIDDTYNASPVAVKAALDVVYSMKAKQKIAILGTMNELGTLSEQSHREVGKYCDPKQLDLVVTIGDQAKNFIAKEAKKLGCEVVSFSSPYDAGDHVKSNLKEGAVILAKGSQNRVFAEESLKVLLAKTADRKRLVRQSNYWLEIKKQQFGRKG